MLGSIAGVEEFNMLKEMGNQNTSGIVEKEQEIGCPDHLEQENEIKTQQDFDAKATESDSCDHAEVQNNPHMESVSHDEKVSEAIDGYPSEEYCHEAETNGLPNSTSKDEEAIEDIDQLSADLSNITPEDVNISSDPQEMRTLSHFEEKCDTKLVQNLVLSEDSGIEYLVVAEKEDVLVETEMLSVDGEPMEKSTHQENCDLLGNIENIENGIRNEKEVGDCPKVEVDSSPNAPHDLPRVNSQDTSALECEVKDECLVLEELLTVIKLSRGGNTFHVDQTPAEEEVQDGNEIDQMVKEIKLVEMKGSVRVDENREEENLTHETTIEEIGTIGNQSSTIGKDREDETTRDKCSSKVGSSLGIKKVNEPVFESEPGHVCPMQYCNIETTALQVLDSNGGESTMENCRPKSESALEIKKVDQPEPDLRLVLPEQYPNNETSCQLVLEPNGGEITVGRCGLKSESSLEIKKVDEPMLLPEPEPEPELETSHAFRKQYSTIKKSSMQVVESNGGENIMEKCKSTSESSSAIKKVNKPQTWHALPEQNSANETSTIQVLELNGGENTGDKCRPTCESSSNIKKLSEPEPKIEPGHVFSEQYSNIEKLTPQVLEPIGRDRTLEKCRSKSESSSEVKRSNESELTSKSKTKPKPELDPKQVLLEQYSNNGTPAPQVLESKEGETTERLSIDSNPNHPIIQLELRKSPSFDFRLPFDSRSEESDQTPLLYQDRTATRRFSSCSSYTNPLQHEAVEVEEKTIRMERSTSDVSRSPFPNLLKEEKLENSAINKDMENGLKGSLSTEGCIGISTKRNGKRKPRSSLFTTCICCTSSSIS